MNKKKLLVTILSLAFVAVFFFLVLRTETNPEEEICALASKQFDLSSQLRFMDVSANIVFCESESGVMPVLTNKEFTKVKNAFHELDFQEFNEEKVERGLISWQADQFPNEKFAMISGFANDEVKAIIINSENSVQPNRFLIRDNLWFWYFTTEKEKVNMPIEVTAFDEEGHVISEEVDE
ncbi:hypothetical protein MUB24_16740 [Lederbergia sp. NSJ-179]|uniref:hypothetical protein n=1 Tax=Lederbergia sp. NSJ-179 TaxID=2931402 RepID=UPI001FD09D3F|nr:hypothetical protein [Lederbergia sp. NSJ-179]MCJ7842512.1 hypothetical protein [Lederbergia sp. NSJ-179]